MADGQRGGARQGGAHCGAHCGSALWRAGAGFRRSSTTTDAGFRRSVHTSDLATTTRITDTVFTVCEVYVGDAHDHYLEAAS